MFNKLRLKLTFINVAYYIMALFTVLITGTFMLTNYGVNQGSYHVMSKLSQRKLGLASLQIFQNASVSIPQQSLV